MSETEIRLIKLTAEFPPGCLDDVRQVLHAAGFQTDVVGAEVRGFGYGDSRVEIYRDIEYIIDCSLLNQLEMVIPAKDFELAVKAIQGAMSEQELTLYSKPIEAAIDIRSGDRVTSGEPVKDKAGLENVLGYGCI